MPKDIYQQRYYLFDKQMTPLRNFLNDLYRLGYDFSVNFQYRSNVVAMVTTYQPCIGLLDKYSQYEVFNIINDKNYEQTQKKERQEII